MNSRGLSVIEVIIGSSIMLILIVAVSTAWRTYTKTVRISNEKTQSALLIEEASEALEFMRDVSWTNKIVSLSLGTTYDIVWNGSTYVATTTIPTIQGIYRRNITFASVARNAQGDIVSSGTVDTKTRKATITVYTNQTPPEVSVQAEMLIHNTYAN